MDQDDQIKPWVRKVVAMAIPFDEKFSIPKKHQQLEDDKNV